MTTAAAAPLHFIAGRSGGRAAHCLVRISTPLGDPHVACRGAALGRRWLELMGVAGQACLLRDDELTAGVAFDVHSQGVLVFEDDAALDAWLLDADGFDYRSRILRPAVGSASDDPW